MDFHCEICDKHINSKSKSKHFKSKSHIDISECDHKIFSLKDLISDEIDEIFVLYLVEHDKKYDFYKVKLIFNLLFVSNSFS